MKGKRSGAERVEFGEKQRRTEEESVHHGGGKVCATNHADDAYAPEDAGNTQDVIGFEPTNQIRRWLPATQQYGFSVIGHFMAEESAKTDCATRYPTWKNMSQSFSKGYRSEVIAVSILGGEVKVQRFETHVKDGRRPAELTPRQVQRLIHAKDLSNRDSVKVSSEGVDRGGGRGRRG